MSKCEQHIGGGPCMCILGKPKMSQNETITCLFLHLRMESAKVALLLVLLACVELCLSASCIVDSFNVKEDFDPKRVSEPVEASSSAPSL